MLRLKPLIIVLLNTWNGYDDSAKDAIYGISFKGITPQAFLEMLESRMFWPVCVV